MASGNIKGITIRFRGETTELDEALRKINEETKAIDKELRAVDKALKFNPSNIELWKQKQQLLTNKISETKEKLEALKQAQQYYDEHPIQKSSAEYKRLQREIIETESKLKTFEGQLRKIGNINLRAMSEQFKDMGNKLTAAGDAMRGVSTAAAALAASIGALTVKSGKWADDINTMSKVYSIGTGELQKYAAAADLVDVDVETIAKSHVKLEKQMMSASKGTGASAEAFNKLGVSVTNADGTLRDGDAVWQDTIKALGSMENETERDALAMQLMGKSAANLNPLIEDGGETYKQVADTLSKYDLDFIDQETLNQANEFNDAIDTMKLLGSVAFAQVGSQLSAYLAPALEKVVGLVGKFAKWLSKLDPKVLAVVGAVAAFVAALAPLLILLGKVAFGISSILNLAGTLGISIGALAGPIGIAIAAIAAIIAIGVLLYKNWDKIKATALAVKTAVVTAFTNLKTNIANIWNAIKSSATATWNAIKTAITNAITNAVSAVKTKISDVKSNISDAWASIKQKTADAWSSIKEKITKPFQSAKETISGIVNTIKGWFPISIGNLFSGLKLPHFSLAWASKDFGKLGTISYPTGIDVSWYAQGGIFDSPSLIGVGEAGAEAVVPLDKFWDKLDKMQGGETNITINVNGSNKDPREIAEEVKRVLIRETNQRRLAWQ